MKILWVKSGALFPPDTGGKIRTLNMLREMNREHEVTFLALQTEPLHADESADSYATHKLWVPFQAAPRRSVKFFAELAANVISSKPYALTRHFSPALRQSLIELDAAGRYDLIVCDFLAAALHFEGHDWRTPVVLFQHNMEAQIWQRMAANHPRAVGRWFLGLQHQRMLRWERTLSELFKGVITVSPEDSAIARERYGLRNVLGDVPAGVDTVYFSPNNEVKATPPVLAFLGSMDWLPNVEGVRWFVREVFPALRAQVPGVRLRIVGRRPGPEIMALQAADPAIKVTGTVEDVRPCLRDATALVVPLLSGGGTRIKILEAMALGLPVISTTVGAEGLPFASGQELLLADDPAALSAACMQLCSDPARAQQLSEAARQKVVEHCSWRAASRRFVELASQVL